MLYRIRPLKEEFPLSPFRGRSKLTMPPASAESPTAVGASAVIRPFDWWAAIGFQRMESVWKRERRRRMPARWVA
ncbi:hypothetical protein CSPX01_03732 [Colletotrichum filicis]|nr:hypothetical protein CSPX01_03732 [Colletotrichum filicis]